MQRHTIRGNTLIPMLGEYLHVLLRTRAAGSGGSVTVAMSPHLRLDVGLTDEAPARGRAAAERRARAEALRLQLLRGI